MKNMKKETCGCGEGFKNKTQAWRNIFGILSSLLAIILLSFILYYLIMLGGSIESLISAFEEMANNFGSFDPGDLFPS